MSRFLWNAKVHYRIHNFPPFVTVLMQMHPINTFSSYFRKIYSSISFPPTWKVRVTVNH